MWWIKKNLRLGKEGLKGKVGRSSLRNGEKFQVEREEVEGEAHRT